MRDIQQQEEIDHEEGRFTNEFQGAYAEASLNRQTSDKIPVDGRFHVVGHHTEYCPNTDAILGGYETLEASFDTRTEAEMKALNLTGEHYDPDHNYDVKHHVKHHVQHHVDKTDCPF